MAKITARGAYKIAQAVKAWTDDEGYKHKQRIALRSDGKILRAHDILSPEMAQYGSRGWNRGGYSIMPERRGVTEQQFRDYAQALGFTMTTNTGR